MPKANKSKGGGLAEAVNPPVYMCVFSNFKPIDRFDRKIFVVREEQLMTRFGHRRRREPVCTSYDPATVVCGWLLSMQIRAIS